MATKARKRPLSPHLSIWKWGPGMTVSIAHRATGTAMATAGIVLFVWWLMAAASGAESYARFLDLITVSAGGLNIVGYVLLIGLSFVFFQHMLSGIRHLFLDVGANYELRGNKLSAIATFVGSVLLTALYWGYILLGRGA